MVGSTDEPRFRRPAPAGLLTRAYQSDRATLTTRHQALRSAVGWMLVGDPTLSVFETVGIQSQSAAVLGDGSDDIARETVGVGRVNLHSCAWTLLGSASTSCCTIYDEFLFEFPADRAEELSEQVWEAMTFDRDGVPIRCAVSPPARSWPDL